MEHTAIPTRYCGINFRSRLEARWAAWFTLVGWKWEYEPVELAGYLPDFIVEHPTTGFGTRRLVEVKPVVDPLLLTEHAGKIERSGWTGHAAIVGATLWDGNPTQHGVEIGAQGVVGDPGSGWGAWIMVPRHRALLAWREAGNLTQWKAPHSAVRP